MALLGIQAGRGKDSLETLDYLDNPQGTLTGMHTHTHTRIKFLHAHQVLLCSIKKKKNNRLTLLSF